MLLDDVVSSLTTAGLVGGATGWTIYASHLPNSPDKAVAVFEAGGEQPITKGGFTEERPRFQIRVRGVKGGYSAARTKLDAIFKHLHALPGNIGTTGEYAELFATQSPISLGLDENDRPNIIQTFRCMRDYV